MTLSSFSFIYLAFYALAVILAYFRARAGTAPKARNSLAAMVIGAVGTLLIYFSSLLAPGGTVPLVLVAALALFPAFLFGAGNLIGLWIATWREKSTVQCALAVIAVGVPLAGILTMGRIAPNAETELLSNIPETQTELVLPKTITGRLGRYPVLFPTSPQINTSYTCFKTNQNSPAQCHTDFATDAALQTVPGDIAIFHEMTIAPKAADCAAPCLTFRQLAQWCQSRADVAFTEWCRNAPSDQITFSYNENRGVNEDEAQGWRALEVAFDTANVSCRSASPSPMCRARYDVARNLQVTILMYDASETNIAPRLDAAQAYVDRVWETMQSSGTTPGTGHSK